ncbi:MAG: cell division protein FtsL [Halioglobus sp.]
MGKAKVNPTPAAIELHSNTRLVWLNAATMCLIVVCAFGVIQTSHACRQLYAQLQILEASRWYMEEDYGRLLLEQSTWASYRRIEQVAEHDLGMQPPAITDMKVLVE